MAIQLSQQDQDRIMASLSDDVRASLATKSENERMEYLLAQYIREGGSGTVGRMGDNRAHLTKKVIKNMIKCSQAAKAVFNQLHCQLKYEVDKLAEEHGDKAPMELVANVKAKFDVNIAEATRRMEQTLHELAGKAEMKATAYIQKKLGIRFSVLSVSTTPALPTVA